MRASAQTAGAIAALSLAIEMFFWYVHPELPPSTDEITGVVLVVGAVVVSCEWTRNRLRGAAAH